MITRLLFVLVVAMIAACSSDPGYQTVSLNTDFELKPGNRAKVDDRFTIRFDSVAEDSRCPTGVNCAWEGNAGVALEYQSPDHPPAGIFLNTAGILSSDTIVQSYRIKLVGVQPVPKQNGFIKKEDYSVKLRVERP
jgi:hypothetical protein